MKARYLTIARIVCAVLSLLLCVGSVTIGAGATTLGDYSKEAERDSIPYYEFDYDYCPHEKVSGNGVVARYPDGETPGSFEAECARCGAMVQTQEIPALKFKSASLVLNDSLAINYKIDKSIIEAGAYTNPYVVFTFAEETITVTDYTVRDGYYVFVYDNIAPHRTNESVIATPYATCHGAKVCAGKTEEYSVADYCYNQLGKAGDCAELKTLLVDLLNYGATAQVYTKRNVENLANAYLTDEQKAWGTTTDRELVTVQDTEYILRDNTTVNWKGAGLSLQDSVAIRFKIDAQSVEGLYAKVVNANGEFIIPAAEFVKTNGGYYVYFDDLSVANISSANYITIYDQNGAVSNTLCYSAESYAYSMKAKGDTQEFIDLINAMIRYGDSAKAYVLSQNGEQPDLSDESWTKPY